MHRFSLSTPPLFAALAALWDNGVRVHLANLSFSELELVDRESWVDQTWWR